MSPVKTPEDWLRECRALAATRGGACLSSAYVNARSKLRWRCSAGHEWETAPGHVKTGKWCRACSDAESSRRQRAASFARMKRMARELGGRCTSKDYERYDHYMGWRCARGHTWQETPEHIAGGRWCPQCADTPAPTSLATLRRVARERGGVCLSATFESESTRMHWRCREGHEWQASASMVVGKDAWCARCAAGECRYLAEARARAELHGGKLVSTYYARASSLLRLRCHVGHEFALRGNNLQQGVWCPKCLGAPKGDLEKLSAVAKRRGGRCLATEYLGSQEKVDWKCARGHVWSARPNDVTAGTWCGECVGRRSPVRLDIEEMRSAAAKRGGECLSEQYHWRTKLLWRCALGHEWRGKGAAVARGGTWCPTCSFRYRGTITGLQLLAADRGGRLLSTFYGGRRVPLSWSCAKGHRFDLLSLAAKSGAWCPICAPEAWLPLRGTGREVPLQG